MHLSPLTLSLASRAIYAGPAALPQLSPTAANALTIDSDAVTIAGTPLTIGH